MTVLLPLLFVIICTFWQLAVSILYHKLITTNRMGFWEELCGTVCTNISPNSTNPHYPSCPQATPNHTHLNDSCHLIRYWYKIEACGSLFGHVKAWCGTWCSQALSIPHTHPCHVPLKPCLVQWTLMKRVWLLYKVQGAVFQWACGHVLAMLETMTFTL